MPLAAEWISSRTGDAGDSDLTAEQAQEIDKDHDRGLRHLVYAGLVGKFMIEKLARVRSRSTTARVPLPRPAVDDRTVVLAITQSGETVDTLAALEEGRETAPVYGRSSTPSAARRPACAMG